MYTLTTSTGAKSLAQFLEQHNGFVTRLLEDDGISQPTIVIDNLHCNLSEIKLPDPYYIIFDGHNLCITNEGKTPIGDDCDNVILYVSQTWGF